MDATNQKPALADALSTFDARCKTQVITAQKAYAHHVASTAQVEAIRRQHEARTSAPGYSATLGAFGSPKAAVAFVNAQLATSDDIEAALAAREMEAAA